MQSTSLKVSLSELIIAVSNALDLMSPSFHSHQKRTCIIACKLGREIGLSEQDYSNLYYASLLHDVGAIGLQEKIDLLGFEEQDADHHALMGAALLDNSRLLSPITPLIKYHHQPWRNGQGKEFPELAHLIHLSDRLEVQCHIPNLLAHSQKIRELIKDGSGGTFKPEHVDVFLRLSEVDAFWFDLTDPGDNAVSAWDKITDFTLATSSWTRLTTNDDVAEFQAATVGGTQTDIIDLRTLGTLAVEPDHAISVSSAGPNFASAIKTQLAASGDITVAVLNGMMTISSTVAADLNDLSEMVSAAAAIAATDGETLGFEFNGHTYVFTQDTDSVSLVELTGVSGVMGLSLISGVAGQTVGGAGYIIIG